MARPDVARPAVTEDEVRAVKALARGEANGAQQQAFIEFLVREAGTDRDCWASTERETSFLLGRRSLGLTVREMVVLPIDALVPTQKRRRRDPDNSQPPQG